MHIDIGVCLIIFFNSVAAFDCKHQSRLPFTHGVGVALRLHQYVFARFDAPLSGAEMIHNFESLFMPQHDITVVPSALRFGFCSVSTRIFIVSVIIYIWKAQKKIKITLLQIGNAYIRMQQPTAVIY